jgi:hypothetical protein
MCISIAVLYAQSRASLDAVHKAQQVGTERQILNIVMAEESPLPSTNPLGM